jgi:hypothetical protein
MGLREVLKVVDQIYSELGDLYQRQVTFTFEGKEPLSTTYAMLLGGRDTFARALIPHYGHGTTAVGASCEIVAGRLTELMDYLRQYEDLSGSSVVSKFYRRRFAPSVRTLQEGGYLARHVLDFYERDIGFESPD